MKRFTRLQIIYIVILFMIYPCVSCSPPKTAAQPTRAVITTSFGEVVLPPPPVPEIVGLNPGLLSTQEPALRSQLQSARVDDSLIPNVATIALRASQSATRLAALSSIGYREYGQGEETMIKLFESLTQEDEKRTALRYIKVESLSSPEANWMIEQLSNATVSDALKTQIIRQLSFGGFIENRGDSNFLAGLQARIPAEWHDALAQDVDRRNRLKSEYVRVTPPFK